jgi:class 3 adenylate cyclase/tetratricopeptide (TPR) repeat protein
MTTSIRVCAQCGAAASDDARFCSQCAAPFGETTSAPASTQERRQVTVFFSDLSGFTALNERLDPEDVRDVVNKVWDRAGEIVGRYDGRINKLLGDAVMAVFGDPVAHEDDPLRAVRAALELHEAVEALNRDVEPRIGSPIGMHTGVNTGVVLTSEAVLDGKQTGPLGDTINVAARLQSLAQTGQVLVGPETRRAIEATFDLEDLGLHDLKGKGEPVPVSRVLSISSRNVTPARRQGRFVGRDTELSLLRDELERARRGTPAFVAVSGEAGSGKTRLVHEFRTRVASDVTWLEGRAYPFAQNIPYYAVTDLISNSLGIDETDSPEAVRTKLEQGIAAIVANSSEILPPLLQLYDIEGSEGSSIDREAYRGRLLQSIRAIVQSLAERGTLIVCLQDLHWADPSTIDLLRQLAAELSASTLMLFNYRPEFSFHEGGIREIRLEELSDRDTRDLVESLLDASSVPNELVTFLEQRTGGNPFFMEEIVNSLIENRFLTRNGEGWALTGQFDAAAVPTTIRGVIAARIDRLDAERRLILQEASVIGREFLFTILSQVSGGDATLADGLSALESADLIRKGHVDPDLEYLFKHALTQEVAYQGLLRSKRHELHGRVGQAMERLLGERYREYAESIAYHFQNSDTPERAVRYLVMAGKKAVERYALAEAETYYRFAYDILLGQPETTERDHDLLELIVEWSLVHYYTADIPAMNRLMKEHAELLERVPDPELLGMWLVWQCFVRYCVMDFAGSIAAADRAVAIGEEAGSARVLAYAHTQRAWALLVAGREYDSVASSEKALELIGRLTDERDTRYIRFKAGAGAALARLTFGDLMKSRATAKDLMDFANGSGSARALSVAHTVLGAIQGSIGDYARAVAELEQGRDVAPDPVYRVIAEQNLCRFLAASGQFEAARTVLDPSLRFSVDQGLLVSVIQERMTEALILLNDGDLTRGMDQLEAVGRQAREVHSPYLEVVAAVTRAVVYAQIATGEAKGSIGVMIRNPGFVIGRARKASQTARDALAKLSENLPPDMEGFRFPIEFEFAKLLIKRKERDEARKHIEKAIAFLQPLGDSVGMRDARALLATLDTK